MPLGIYLAISAYSIFSIGDAIIKSFGTSLSVFDIAFWTTLASVLPVLVSRPKNESLRDIFKTKSLLKVSARALSGLTAMLLVVYAFTHIPLAEVYALVFLTPALITIMAVVFLKEQMTPRRWLGLALGFVGVLLVVRPGFRDLHLGHFAALACAFFASLTAILLRSLSQTEKRTTIFGYAALANLTFSGTIILATEGPHLPAPHDLILLTTIGMLGGVANVLIMTAARTTPASWIAQVQYVQIIWAIGLGAAFYNEIPGPFTLAGLGVVALAGLVNVSPERARIWFRFPAIPPRTDLRRGGAQNTTDNPAPTGKDA